MVGERGFEPPTPWSRTRCSTRLSHSPTLNRPRFYYSVRLATCKQHSGARIRDVRLNADQCAAIENSRCQQRIAYNAHSTRGGSPRSQLLTVLSDSGQRCSL
jgi:hypothetical protein